MLVLVRNIYVSWFLTIISIILFVILMVTINLKIRQHTDPEISVVLTFLTNCASGFVVVHWCVFKIKQIWRLRLTNKIITKLRNIMILIRNIYVSWFLTIISIILFIIAVIVVQFIYEILNLNNWSWRLIDLIANIITITCWIRLKIYYIRKLKIINTIAYIKSCDEIISNY